MQCSQLKHNWKFEDDGRGSVIQVQALLSRWGFVGGDTSCSGLFGNSPSTLELRPLEDYGDLENKK